MSRPVDKNDENIDSNKMEMFNKDKASNCPPDSSTLKRNAKSRIQLLQERLLESNQKPDCHSDRNHRNKELEELAAHRLVNFDQISIEENKTTNSSNFVNPSSEFPSIPSELISFDSHRSSVDEQFDCENTILSSEWRDETLHETPQESMNVVDENDLLYSPPADNFYFDNNIHPMNVNDISVEKIHAFDRTMENLEELELVPRKSFIKNIKPTLISKSVVNSEPPSPTKLNISKRDIEHDSLLYSSDNDDHSNNGSFSTASSSLLAQTNDKSKRQLVKTSTKFVSNPSKYSCSTLNNNYNSPSNYKDNSFNRHMANSKNSSPIVSTPLNNKDNNHNLKSSSKAFTIFKSAFNNNDGIAQHPIYNNIPSSFNDSDSYTSKFESPLTDRIETRREYHVKRRSLSATQTTINSNTYSLSKVKSNTGSSTTNFSIGFNPSLNSYDHPDDVSRNLSFSTVDSACALHNNEVRDTLIRKYYAAAKVQQQLIAQSENILSLICTKEGNINDSARLPCCLDAESLLLLSTYRRNLFLHKASKLKRGAVPCKCNPESNRIATAAVSVSDICIQISESFTNKLKCSQPDSFYYFMAIITFGDSDVVFCTTPVSIYDLGAKGLLVLPGTFSYNDMRCDESVNIEIYARTLSNKKDSNKLSDILKIRFRKRPMKHSTNARNTNSEFKNRECAFKFVASCAIPISEKKSDVLTLFNRAPDIPLDAQLNVKLSFQPNFESYAQGFLMEGGLPCWKRYWCVLHQECLKMWNWKDDDPKDYEMSVDLTWDVDSSCKLLPQHICARSNTLEISLISDPNSKTFATPNKEFISKSNNLSSDKYCIWLSADSSNECGVWLSALSLHQARYRDWKKAVHAKYPSVPSRRLV